MKRFFENIEFPSVKEVIANIFMVILTCGFTFIIIKVITFALNKIIFELML